MRKSLWVVGTVLSVSAGLFVVNSSTLAAAQPLGTPGVLAHRGIHQTFPTEGLTRNTCTASRINPPTNPFLENTLPSMRASFAAGATALELDVHPTTDGEFAVFHDWRLECRTNGEGVTRRQTMAYLKTLDVGHGYTADGGKTFPFRGKGVGMMPTLLEVFRTFPGRQLLINVKSNDPTEADRLIAYLAGAGIKADGNLWIFADKRPRLRLREIAPRARVVGKEDLKSCSQAYLLKGWTGSVPESCRGRFIAVPVNLTATFWGWPNRFMKRMKEADVRIMLVGPVGQGGGIGIEDPEDLKAVPRGFDGVIVTDNVEVIGPAVRQIAARHAGVRE